MALVKHHAVDAALLKQTAQLVGALLNNANLQVGVARLEVAQHVGQPVGRDVGLYADDDGALGHAADASRGLAHLLVGRGDLFEERQHPAAFRRELDARSFAHEHRKAQLLLKGIDKADDARRRVAELLGGGGHRAALGGGNNSRAALYIHEHSPQPDNGCAADYTPAMRLLL